MKVGNVAKKKEVLGMKTTKLVSIVMALVFLTTTGFAQPLTYSGGLTHGMVTKSIKKGETSQAEILQLFGAPNITTISKKGEEVWTYDRISYAETTHGGADTKAILLGGATGAGIGAIVGHQSKETRKGAALGGVLGAIAGFLFGYKDPVHEQGSKTVTLMLWFDENDIVKDYSIITSQF